MLDRLISPRQKGRYAPRDDCSGLPGANAFRRQLADAVARRDGEAIAALALPDVRLGFGGDDGQAALRARLKGGDLMDALARLLPLGCAPGPGGALTIPWSFAQDMGDIDVYSAMIVMGEDVPVRAAASAGAPVVRQVSWDVVELGGGPHPDAAFQQVRTPDGAKGFVATASLRSALDTRLLANRTGDGWKIAAIVAGD